MSSQQRGLRTQLWADLLPELTAMLNHTFTSCIAPTRVIVLGASGFIGSHLIADLAHSGIETVEISSAKIDLAGHDAMSALAGIIRRDDTLVFASCLTREKGEDLPTLMKNLAMAQNVGLFLEKHGCAQVVYLSSDAIYKDGIPLVREDSESNPGGLYGVTHVARERMMVHSAGKAGIPLAILRPCAVYGVGDTHNGYGPNRFLRTALAQGKISLFGRGEETRDHIFVGDVCSLIRLCIGQRSTGILNLATGQAHEFAHVAEVVIRVVARSVEIEYLPRRTPITHRHFDITAMLKAFPLFTFVSLEQGLLRIVRSGKVGVA
jgi:nucleoside-diphosphate-sugar epimerase